LTKAEVQSGMHRVLLLWSHICSAGHVLQLRRGAGVQKFATARWLVNGCQSTPTVHIRKGTPSASAKPKVRDNRMNPIDANECQSSGPRLGCIRVCKPHTGDFALHSQRDPWLDCFWRVGLPSNAIRGIAWHEWHWLALGGIPRPCAASPGYFLFVAAIPVCRRNGLQSRKPTNRPVTATQS
jgi:hypothetical protein